MTLEYGVFNCFWGNHPNHLPLLNLQEDAGEPEEWNLGKSIELLDEIIAENSQNLVVEGVSRLLMADNWRPHLVACLAVLKVDSSQRKGLIDSLWKRLQNGSWVSPQILVVLSMIDEGFMTKANSIFTNGFVVLYSDMPAAESHSARGPLGAVSASKKVVAAIQYLLDGTINDSADSDSGGNVAMTWKIQLLQLIQNGRFSVAGSQPV